MLASKSARRREQTIKNVAGGVRTVEQLRDVLAGTKMSCDMQSIFWGALPDRIAVDDVLDAAAVSQLIPHDPDMQVWDVAQMMLRVNPDAANKILDTFESHKLPVGRGMAEVLIETRNYERLAKTPEWVWEQDADKVVRWIVQDPELWKLIDKGNCALSTGALRGLAPFYPRHVASHVSTFKRDIPIGNVVAALAPHLQAHEILVDMLCAEPSEYFASMNITALRPTVNQLRRLLTAHPTQWKRLVTGIASLTPDTIEKAVALIDPTTVHPGVAELAPQRWLPSSAAVAKYLRLFERTMDQTPTLRPLEELIHKAKMTETGGPINALKHVVEHCVTEAKETIQDYLLALCALVSEDDVDCTVRAVVEHIIALDEPTTNARVAAVVTTLFGTFGFFVTDLTVWTRLAVRSAQLFDVIGLDLCRIARATKHPETAHMESLYIRRILCIKPTCVRDELAPCTRRFDIERDDVPDPIWSQTVAELVRSPHCLAILQDMIAADAPRIAGAILSVMNHGVHPAIEVAVQYLVTLGDRDRTDDDARLLEGVIDVLERRYACDYETDPFLIFERWWGRLWLPKVDWETVLQRIYNGQKTAPARLVEFAQRVPSVYQTSMFGSVFDTVAPWENYYRLREWWYGEFDGRALAELARFVPSGTEVTWAQYVQLLRYLKFGSPSQAVGMSVARVLLSCPSSFTWNVLPELLATWTWNKELLCSIAVTSIDDDGDLIEVIHAMCGACEMTLVFDRLMFDNAALLVETVRDAGLLIDFTKSYHEALVAAKVREWLVTKKHSSEWREAVLKHAVTFGITVTPDLPAGSLSPEDVPTGLDKPWPECFATAVAYTEAEVEFVEEEPKASSWF